MLSAYGHQAFGLAFGGLFSMSSNLGLILTVMSVFILMLVVLYLWYSSMSAIFICNMVLIIATAIVGAFTANNIFVFLIFFELSSLPIFVLLSYSGSMRRERVKALYYFLFFTLYGSLSLLLVLISLYSLMSDQQTMFLYDERVFWVLIFLAFAIKLPLFPFHI